MNKCNLSELYEHFIKEEPQPDAFALTVCAHHVHPVVPITRAHERQAVYTKADASQDGPHTVIVQTGRLFRPAGKIVIRVLVRIYRAALDEVDGFIQYSGVSGIQNVTARGQRQPEEIIRTVCTHAAP